MALAVCMLAVVGLSACQLQTNTQVESNLTPKLDASATINEGVLTVGINANNSPYGGTNASNQTVGIDVDVAAAIAQELGLRMQIVDVGSSGRFALSNKQIDVALGLTKSGTGDLVSYSDSYLTDGLSLFCLSTNKPVSIEDVAAQANAGTAKILVQADTTAASKVQELLGIDKVVAMPTMQDAFDALNDGEQKFLVTDAVIGDYFARNYENVIRMGFLELIASRPSTPCPSRKTRHCRVVSTRPSRRSTRTASCASSRPSGLVPMARRCSRARPTWRRCRQRRLAPSVPPARKPRTNRIPTRRTAQVRRMRVSNPATSRTRQKHDQGGLRWLSQFRDER